MTHSIKFEEVPATGYSIFKNFRRSSGLSSAAFFLKLLWLFTRSDMLTFVIPDTAFGILGALSGSLLTSNASPNVAAIFARTPLVSLFIWINLLVFDLANQRLPESIIEDRFNKPWRPLPNGLISAVQTRRLLLSVLPFVLGISYFMGVWKETLLLFTLTWMYNDLKGGDEDFIVRNIIIGAAFGFYNEGALRIACGAGYSATDTGFQWIVIISCIIFSTMHVQDMRDQVGDLAKSRRSAPIVLGDWVARWTIAVPVVFWSLLCPFYWNVPIVGWVLPVGAGSLIAIRELCYREPQADQRTYVLWTGWLSCLYLLPIIKNLETFPQWSSF